VAFESVTLNRLPTKNKADKIGYFFVSIDIFFPGL